MPIHRLTIARNHLLAELTNGFALIDTGSPVSYGGGRRLEIGDSPSEPPVGPVALLHEISREVGVEVEWLIGNDILGTWVVMLDWPGREIHFQRAANEAVGTTIRVDLRLGIPQLDISVEGRTVRAVLDSGAQLSYADREVATRHSPVGVVEDFYPVLGRFETRVYRFAVTVQGREIDAQWGILPDRLRHLLPLAGARWILGVDFFKDRRIVLDFARGRVVDCR